MTKDEAQRCRWTFYEAVNDWVRPLLFIAGGLVLGIVCEKVVLRKLRGLAARTR